MERYMGKCLEGKWKVGEGRLAKFAMQMGEGRREHGRRSPCRWAKVAKKMGEGRHADGRQVTICCVVLYIMLICWGLLGSHNSPSSCWK